MSSILFYRLSKNPKDYSLARKSTWHVHRDEIRKVLPGECLSDVFAMCGENGKISTYFI